MSLDRLDAVVFTGGVAAYQPEVVNDLIRGLGVLGVTTPDDGGAGDRFLSLPGCRSGDADRAHL